MSLIEQALRRIQQPRAPLPSPQLPEPTTRPQPQPLAPSAPSTSSNPWTMFVVAWVGIGVLVFGLVAGALWTYRLMVSAPRDLRPLPVSVAPGLLAQAPQGSPGSDPSPSSAVGAWTPLAVPEILTSFQASAPPTKPAAPAFELNGIVEGVGEPFAIINGRIVRLGESVEGAVLLEIKEGSATLRLVDQEELVLHTTH